MNRTRKTVVAKTTSPSCTHYVKFDGMFFTDLVKNMEWVLFREFFVGAVYTISPIDNYYIMEALVVVKAPMLDTLLQRLMAGYFNYKRKMRIVSIRPIADDCVDETLQSIMSRNNPDITLTETPFMLKFKVDYILDNIIRKYRKSYDPLALTWWDRIANVYNNVKLGFGRDNNVIWFTTDEMMAKTRNDIITLLQKKRDDDANRNSENVAPTEDIQNGDL